MKLKQLVRGATLSASCFLAVPVTCNSILAKSTAKPDDGYEYVTELGSNLLKRVKKGSQPDSSSQVKRAGAEEFRRDQNMSEPRLPGSGN